MDEDARNPVEVLAEEFVARIRQGESPSVEEYVRRHPEHAEEIEDVFPAALLVERMKTGTGWPSSPSAPAHAPMPSIERLGDYRVVDELGRGGMGVVYEAEQETLHRRVALKVLLPWAMGSSDRVERFRREAQAAATLHHTNIVQVFGVGEQDGLHYYVMQLVQGRGLDAVLAEEGAAFTPRRAARIALQTARALAHAHERGVLHRDVKPANVLLDAQDTAWIADFGLAKVLQDPHALTETGDIIGTIRYMPPERFEGRSDERGDIYGLGLTLYELLAGRAAFADKDRGSLLRAVREGAVRSPRRFATDLPRDLETIVMKASAREPANRYASAADLAHDLECFLADRPILARPAGALERSLRWCRRNKAVASLAAVAVLAVLLAAAVGWTGYLLTQRALQRESEERRQAQAATRHAEANAQMSLEALEGIFESLGALDDLPPPPGPNAPSGPKSRFEGELLRNVLAFYDLFAAANETNPRLRYEAARALRHAATLHARTGDAARARDAFARAVTALEALRKEQPDETEYTRHLIRTLADASMWAAHAGADDDALRDARQAVDLARAQGDSTGEDARTGGLRVLALCRLAVARTATGDEARAREVLEEARLAWDALPRDPDVPPGIRPDLARAYEALARRRLTASQEEGALEDLDAALDVLASRRGRAPHEAAPPGDLARIHRGRAEALRALGRVDEARAAERAAHDADASRRGRRPGMRPPPR